MMKKLSFSSRFLLCLSAGFLYLACINPVLAYSKDEWKSAAQIYASTCHYCHDTGVGPVLMGRQLPASYIEIRVRNGFNAMPSFKPSEIGVSDLGLLAKWISESVTLSNQIKK